MLMLKLPTGSSLRSNLFSVMAAIFAFAATINGQVPNFPSPSPWPSTEGWDVVNPSLIRIVPGTSSDNKALQLEADAGSPSDAVSTKISRRISAESFDPNYLYTLEAEVRAESFPTEYFFYISHEKEGSEPVYIGKEVRQVGSNSQYVQIEIPISNSMEMDVTIALYGPGKLWIDDLRIRRVSHAERASELERLSALPPFKGSADAVQITPDGRFLVEGKPFFPIGMWGIDFPDDAMLTALHEFGFNLTGTGHLKRLGPEGTKTFLDRVASLGLRAIVVTRFAFKGTRSEVQLALDNAKKELEPILAVTKNHSGVFAYDIGDEPAWNGDNMLAFAEGSKFIRKFDPNHLVFSNQAPRQRIDIFKKWYRFVDVGGSDIYPWYGGDPDKHSDLPNDEISVVGDETIKNLDALGGKPAMMTLQAFGWSENTPSPIARAAGWSYPPEYVQRFMAYDAIINGASGVLFYQDRRYKVINPGVQAIAGELSALHDALAAPTLELEDEIQISNPAIKGILKKTEQGSEYAILVNRSGTALEVQLHFSDPTSQWTIHSTDSSNPVSARDSLSFPAWGVQILTKTNYDL